MSDCFRVLVFVSCYLPGYKSGGPVRTIANLVEHLGDEFAFYIVASDRDATATEPYPGIAKDQWNSVGKAQVFYLPPEDRSLSAITALIRQTEHDVLYLNSFFNPVFTFLPLLGRKLGRIPLKPVVIAPRGEFSEGALGLKKWKKFPYVFTARAMGLYRNLTWQASSRHEVRDIRRYMGTQARAIVVAPNLPPPVFKKTRPTPRNPEESLKIVFLSRITPMKNLDFALRVLEKVSIPAVFNIYGPVRDAGYWNTCEKLLKNLPPHIAAKFHGSVHPRQVPGIMQAHDLFFLPTRGENYGHVIAEALSAGTPVLISDTTPWRGMEAAGVGWDLSLDNEAAFGQCIERCFYLEKEKYAQWRSKIQDYARRRLNDPKLIEANRRLFLQTLF